MAADSLKQKKVLVLQGSPKEDGNTNFLLERFIEGLEGAGVDLFIIQPYKLDIKGCKDCEKCDTEEQCVIKDDMIPIYELISKSSAIVVATPIFFYSLPSELKAVIDRCQIFYTKGKRDSKKERRLKPGYFFAIGASSGKRLFDGAKLTIRYFFDAIGVEYRDELFLRGIESKSDFTKEHIEKINNIASNLIKQIE